MDKLKKSTTKGGSLEMGFETSEMFGRYSRALAEFAREKRAEMRKKEQAKKEEKEKRSRELLGTYRGKWATRVTRVISLVWQSTFAKIGEDWVFLALLGIIMALISYVMDYGAALCSSARRWLYQEVATHVAAQFFAWVFSSVFLVLFSVAFTSYVAPQAIGSGIPEMKTILRGVSLKEYLTFRTGVTKMVALTTALGSGLPMGKEGPMVHISSIVATLMSKMVTSFKGIYENESRNNEMLAAACAVGLAVNFAAPIGGVLFSIEVTSVYFAIRNYWRGFFSAVFGALMYRLLAYWSNGEETLTATFSTDFRVDIPYEPHELFVYILMGAFGGLAGATFILSHRKYVLFMRKNKRISNIIKKNRFIYPGIVSVFIACLYFPQGAGKYLLTSLTPRQQIINLFANFTFLSEDLTEAQANIVSLWGSDPSTLFTTLGIYGVAAFFITILAVTIPLPHGSLIPIFGMGAAFGRMIGELMNLWFPYGIQFGSTVTPIIPGGYAIVGAAAFSAGVTHSISICIVICEMTGHIRHIIPIMIAVLVSNAISSLIQPSYYDSIIMIKKLPYLPSIASSGSAAYNIFVEDFMNRGIKYIWNGMTYNELREMVREGRRVRSFPLVDSPSSMILLGSVQRNELIRLIERHVGRDRRLQVAAKWQRERISRQCELLSRASPERPATIDELEWSNEKEDDINQRFSYARLEEALESHVAPESQQATQSAEQQVPKQQDDERKGVRQTIGAMIRKSSTVVDLTKSAIDSLSQTIATNKENLNALQKRFTMMSKVAATDMTPEEQAKWEAKEMMKPVDFHTIHVDPAPFQLVEHTSLLKVHSIFSLLGVNHAYVTTIGQLIGVVSLKELRKAIEDVNSGTLHSKAHKEPSAGGNNCATIEASPGAPVDVEHGRRDASDSDSESESEMETMNYFGPGNSRVVERSRGSRSSASASSATLAHSETTTTAFESSGDTSSETNSTASASGSTITITQ